MKAMLVGAIIVILFGVAIFAFSRQNTEPIAPPTPQPVSQSPKASASPTELQAKFRIITGNITRDFSNPKYHNQSKDVYIEASNPPLIRVTKSGVTWKDFFTTLPMQISKDCLVTGDGEKLCHGESGTLKFYLNDKEEPNLLNLEIENNDYALITYK